VKTIRTSFNNRFCIGDETPDLNQDCGTDAEFAAAIQATLNDVTDIQPLLEKIESTGLMAQTVEDALEKQKRKIEADYNDVKEALKTKLDKSHPKDYFLNSQKTREAGQACSVAAWLGT
jgi:DnaJ-domain-containing protein 1